jgi:hypothetical protein
MRTQKVKRTDQEYREGLLRLKELGVLIGCAPDPAPEPDRLILESIQPGFARLFELPGGAVAVVAPVRMTVLTAGMVITGLQMTTALDDAPLELEDPEEWNCYRSLMDWLYFSTEVINAQLTSGIPLRPCRREGVILAIGWSVVPERFHDEMPVRAELSLRDERLNEVCVPFKVRVDRSLKLKYEWIQARRRERMRALNPRGTGMFGPKAGPLGGKSRVSPEEAVKPRQASGNDDAEIRKPN